MDRAESRYRRVMCAPRTGGLCRYCAHSVSDNHVGDWCSVCENVGDKCGAAELLDNRKRERTNGRVAR